MPEEVGSSLHNNKNNTNLQISSIDFIPTTRSVSTGLGLSLDDRRTAGSSFLFDSTLFPTVGEEFEREIQRQDMELDRFLKLQVDLIKDSNTIELGSITEKNSEPEQQVRRLSLGVASWQQNNAKYNEDMIMTLKFNLQEAYAQGMDNKEGYGDSEVDDTASCCNRKATTDFHLRNRANEGFNESIMICNVCRAKQVQMLLLPCHLCLCKDGRVSLASVLHVFPRR